MMKIYADNAATTKMSGTALEAMLPYMTEHFGRYGSEGKSKLLVYEAEYILGGKASDRENLEYVLNYCNQ